MTDIPVVLSAAGRTNTPPATLNAELIALVAAINPGCTANLPGSLIEDISSTDTGALTLIDQAVTETLDSITPYGANAWLLTQLGNVYGVQVGNTTNTSVYCVFTAAVGYVIPQGFTVSDGAYQYTVRDGGVIASGGSSSPLYCLATTTGSWAVPANTVTSVVTSVPSGLGAVLATTAASGTGSVATINFGGSTLIPVGTSVVVAGVTPTGYNGTVTVTASAAGSISYASTTTGAQTVAGTVTTPFLVTNPQPGTPSAGAQTEGQYRAQVLQAGQAICTGMQTTLKKYLSNVSGVQPRLISVLQASPGWEIIVGGGDPYEVANAIFASVGDISLLVGSSTTARNITVNLYDYPNTYSVIFVNPPAQVVTIGLTWNTTSTNYIAPASIVQLGNPAIAAYVNSLPVGQPINQFELQTVFQAAVANVVPPQLLSRMVWTYTINSTPVSPTSGTGLIPSDPESYFTIATSAITITQG